MSLGRAIRIGAPAVAGFLAATAAFEQFDNAKRRRGVSEKGPHMPSAKPGPSPASKQAEQDPKHKASGNNSSAYDLAVVGAGIVGSSTALFAKQLNPGAKIVLIDADSVASGTSSHSAGTLWVNEIIPRGENRTVKPTWDEILASETLQCYRTLEKDGFDCELEESGALLVAGNEEESLYVAQVYLDLVDRGYTLPRLLDADSDLQKIEPRLKCHSALFLPISSHVDPMLATINIAAQAQRLGVEIRGDFEVNSVKNNRDELPPKLLGEKLVESTESLSNSDSLYTITSSKGQVIQASKVVIANGIHASKLLPERLKVLPVKGQIVLSEERLPPKTLRTVIFSASAYTAFANQSAGRPTERIPAEMTHDEKGLAHCRHLYGRQRKDGHILMGGGRIPVLGDLDYSPDLKVLEEVTAHVDEILDLKEARLHESVKINSWACFMPFSMDLKPYLGELRESRGLFVAAGFGPEGMTLGPAAGKALASLIWNGEPADELDAIVLKALSPNRPLGRSR